MARKKSQGSKASSKGKQGFASGSEDSQVGDNSEPTVSGMDKSEAEIEHNDLANTVTPAERQI